MSSIDSAKDLNKELKSMADRFNEKVGGPGTLKSALDTALFKGNMVQSANLGARITEYRGASGEAKEGLLAALVGSVESLARVDVRWKAIADEIQRTGMISEDTEKSMKILSDGMMNAKMAAEQLKTAQSELNRAMNATNTRIEEAGYSAVILPCNMIHDAGYF